MVLSFEETKELETLKYNQKIALTKMNGEIEKKEHLHKMDRLALLLEIARAGGKPTEGE